MSISARAFAAFDLELFELAGDAQSYCKQLNSAAITPLAPVDVYNVLTKGRFYNPQLVVTTDKASLLYGSESIELDISKLMIQSGPGPDKEGKIVTNTTAFLGKGPTSIPVTVDYNWDVAKELDFLSDIGPAFKSKDLSLLSTLIAAPSYGASVLPGGKYTVAKVTALSSTKETGTSVWGHNVTTTTGEVITLSALPIQVGDSFISDGVASYSVEKDRYVPRSIPSSYKDLSHFTTEVDLVLTIEAVAIITGQYKPQYFAKVSGESINEWVKMPEPFCVKFLTIKELGLDREVKVVTAGTRTTEKGNVNTNYVNLASK